MKQTLFTTALLLGTLFFACKETPKTPENVATAAEKAVDTTTKRVIETAVVPAIAPDSLIVTVDSTGKVMMGNVEIKNMDNLAKMIVDSSNALKKTFGKAPKTIVCKSNGAMMGIRGAIRDAIDDAQEALKKQK
jgi:arabinogalactan endo-1,4-beta-galactosidase